MTKTSKKEPQSILSRFLQPLQHKPKAFIKGLCQTATRATFDVYTILVFKRIGDMVDQGDFSLFENLFWEYLIVFLIYNIIKGMVRNRSWPDNEFAIKRRLWNKYLHTFVTLENTAVDKLGTGRLINMLKEGINERVAAITQLTFAGPNLVFKIVIALVFVRSIGPWYGIGFLCIIILTRAIVIAINRYAIQQRNERKKLRIERDRRFVRFLHAKQEITQSNKVTHEITQGDERLDHIRETNQGLNFYLWIMFSGAVAVTQILTLLVIVYVRQTGKQGTFSYGTFTALVAIVGYLTQLMVNSTKIFKDITKQFTHIQKLRDLMDTTPKAPPADQGKQFIYHHGEIQLQGLTFAYDDNKPIFQKFDLTITGGQKTALVGPSGSGKSTLIKLIAAYITPDQGTVSVDGQALDVLALNSYYQHVGYLTQEPLVFDGTIYDNLIYSLVDHDNHDHTQITQKLKQAITLAKCEFVRDLPQGLQTEIGERGIRLSGGQRQRLAIAKVILKDPKIILLDEPTAALDSFSEEAVTQAMNNLFADRTVIIIAHRLQTVKAADNIIVIDDGQVIERGTHIDLLQAEGYYAKMLELQSSF